MFKKLFIPFLAFASLNVSAQNSLTVYPGKPITPVSKTMWGVFFEDINFAADGGLYAELIKNRSFEFYNPMMGWREIKKDGGNGKILIINNSKVNVANPRYAKISVDANSGTYALSNEGFRGVGVQKEKQYVFSLLAKKETGNVSVKVSVVNATGQVIGSGTINDINDKYTRHSVSFTTTDTANKGRVEVAFIGKGTIDVDMISLFPKDTWKNRPNGLRSDLVQMLYDLKPGFVRFPGGCIVEGHELATRYQWKKTVGDVNDRTAIINRWNTEMRNRQTPDYYQSYGLGFYEYFQLAEDLGSEPLPILNCGMACQFNTGEVVPVNELDPYIQDALDLIEFANAPVTSKWGKLRASMGHPKPFNLKMMGVGNEQWDEQYIERYKLFVKAIKAKYPSIRLVTTSGPSPDDARFKYLWSELKKLNAEIIDEHYYMNPSWFMNNASRYDDYDRNGPKVFAGEYASHAKEDKQSESRNTWMSALSEAAFMTGLERNADVVQMASYAPLFAHIDAWQWRPDLIWFDNLRSVGTPNYYVQKMFSTNKGTDVVPILNNGKILAGADSLYASSTIDKQTGDLIIKLVNTSSNTVTYDVNAEGGELSNNAMQQILTTTNPWEYNTVEAPKNVYPTEKTVRVQNNKIPVVLAPMSLNVIRVGYKG